MVCDVLSFVRGRATDKGQLQRHGARWPTTNSGEEIKATVKKLKRVKHYKEHYLKFLKHFTWDLGADDLLPFGATQYALTDSVGSPE